MREPKLNRALIAAALAASSAAGCKARSDGSDVKHVFGETRRDLAEPPIPCDQSAFTTKFPVADAYLRRLTSVIAEANPKTLSGAFAPDRLCIDMADTEEFNARAMSRFMIVTINRPILEFAASDAEVASVLAHELAHVVMRHDSAVHPDVAKEPPGAKLVAERSKLEDEGKQARAAREQLAADERAHYERQRARLSRERPEFGRAVRRMDEINAEVLKLTKREPANFGPPNTPYPRSEFGYYDSEGLDTTGKARYETLRKDFDDASSTVRDVVWKFRSKDEKAAESRFFSETFRISDLERANMSALSANRAALEARTIEVLGAEAAANWMEAEADEVGYELYLRAGFVGEGFTWINRVMAQILEVERTDDGLLSTEQVLEACLAARKDPKKAIERGAGDHPTSCWRLADIRLKEDKDHEAEYAPLKAKATTLNLSGSPSLADAKQEINAAKAKASNASGEPSAAPGP